MALFLSIAAPTAAFSGVLDLYERSAGTDLKRISHDVGELAALAESHIANVGRGTATRNFQEVPSIREANGLHLWGVTVSGTH
ncbi:MAG: hypothetical protein ACRBM6_05120 [Geminicoccales bacterium]